MKFCVFGEFEGRADDGTRLDLGGPRQRAVLARLLIARGEPVPAERIIDDVWNGAPPPAAPGVLQAYISNLRRALEPDRRPRAPATVLRTRPNGYALVADSDADTFTALVERGVQSLADGRVGEGVRALADARTIWRGEPYADFADAAWLAPEMARLRELRLIADEHRLAAALAGDAAHRAVPELEQLVRENPLREGFLRLLALALYRTGRQADALAVVDRTRRTLRDELGLDPSPALRELESAILAQSDELGSSTVPTPTATVPASPTTGTGAPALVGRDDTIEAILAAARATAGRGPGAQLVSGAAGTGKTGLGRAVAARAETEGWRAAWGACYDTTGAPALWPWLQVLGDLAESVALPNDVRALVNDEIGAPIADAAEGRFRQSEAIRRYLAECARRRPLLLVFDDVQWADTASLHLIADLVALGRTGGIFVLLLTRPTAGALSEPLIRLDRSGALRSTLTPLTPDEVAEVVRRSGHELAASDVDALARRTGGNPFFVHELLRLADRSGTDAALQSVPDSVGDLVRHQLALLPPEAQTVLRVAAVLGRDIEPDVLAEVSGEDPDDIWDALDSGVLAGMLVGDTRLRFVHDLVRESLVGDVAPMRQARLHARVVVALESRGGLDVARLAEHARAAGPLARPAAIVWASRAAEQASSRFAHVDAARWRAAAVEASEAAGQARTPGHVELMLALVGAQLESGDAIGARETRNAAVAAAAGLDDTDVLARALVALDAPALWQLRHFDQLAVDFVAQLDRTLAAWPEGDSELRCRLMATLGSELYSAVVDPRCGELTAEAVAMARRLGDPEVLVFALNARLFALARPDHDYEQISIGTELLELGTALRRPDVQLLGHQILANQLLRRFEVTAADAHARAADRLLVRLDLPVPRLQQLCYWLGRSQLDGRFDDGDDLVADINALTLSWWARGPLVAGIVAMQHFVAGRLDEATDLLPEVRMVQPESADDLARLLGRPAPPGWGDVPRDWGWEAAMAIRGVAATSCGTDEVRREVYAQLLPMAGHIAVTSGLAYPIDWSLAALARALGDDAAAKEHLDRLTRLAERDGLAYWVSRSAS